MSRTKYGNFRSFYSSYTTQRKRLTKRKRRVDIMKTQEQRDRVSAKTHACCTTTKARSLGMGQTNTVEDQVPRVLTGGDTFFHRYINDEPTHCEGMWQPSSTCHTGNAKLALRDLVSHASVDNRLPGFTTHRYYRCSRCRFGDGSISSFLKCLDCLMATPDALSALANFTRL